MTDLPRCSICGGLRYSLGPNGRPSRQGLPPRCTGCGSLERHRRLRAVYGHFPESFLAGLQVLQLSPDIGVEPDWFCGYEVSEYGGDNSLDLEHIDRPDNSYDLLICNHVLEHVGDDRQGYRELLRITQPMGLVQITVPSPYTQASTRDWGYPRSEAHGHYRGYGRDIIDMFHQAAPEAAVLEAEVHDPVTGDGDYIYFSTQNAELADKLHGWLPSARRTAAT
jgi:SAM-dependent methyltransferase